MVKYTLVKKEYNHKGKLSKVVAKRKVKSIYNRYPAFDCFRVWSTFCSTIEREDHYKRNVGYKTYTPLAKRNELILRKKEEVRSREERRQNCKCKEICLNEFKQCQIE